MFLEKVFPFGRGVFLEKVFVGVVTKGVLDVVDPMSLVAGEARRLCSKLSR